MPNCWNTITVIGSKDDIQRFWVDEFKGIPSGVHEIFKHVEEGIHFKVWTLKKPDFVWLESLPVKYPSLWIKNIWKEEFGRTGVWIRTMKDIQRIEWDDRSIEDVIHRSSPSSP